MAGQDPCQSLVLGIILIVFVLLVPRGLVPTLGDLGAVRYWRARGSAAMARPVPKRAEEG